MNIHIHDSLLDIERRIQEILDEIRSIREQVFYSYDPNDSETEDIHEDLDAERYEAFESLVNNDD